MVSSTHFTSILGVALTTALVLAGQTGAGFLVDHFGWLGTPGQPLDRNRALAVAFIAVPSTS